MRTTIDAAIGEHAVRVLRAAFVVAAVSWAALLVIAPWLATRADASTPAGLLILGVYGAGSLICHQLPERSIHLWGAQMPVCARCTGIYLGAALVAVARGLSPRSERSPEGFALRHARLLLVVAVVPTLLTLVVEWGSGTMPSHAIRFAAGLPIGLAVAWLVVAAADNQVN